MRNLKRALSLALALVMVLSMMVVGAGAVSVDDFSDGADIVNKEAVTVLATLNVINGKEDGSYDPTGNVTRGEMAKMICVILNGGNDPVLGETVADSYTDTASHWAKAYIEYCTTLGIVAGKGDGTFDPNGQVTVAEAGKMVLVALGYNAGVEGYTGGNWQINTDVRANALGLYDDLDYTNTSAALTRDNAAQMLYNALDCKMVTYDYIITGTVDNAITTKPQLNDWDLGTLLWEKFKAVKLEGVVVANEYADLDSTRKDTDKAPAGTVIGSHLDAGKTTVLVTNYDANSEQSIFRNQEYTFNTVSGEDVLAKSVYVYIKPYNETSDNANRATVIGTVNVSEDNTIVTDASGDSVTDVADDNNLDLVSDTQYIYNYAQMDTLDVEKLPSFDGKVGIEKTLVDTDADGDVNYVLYKEMGLGKVTAHTTASDGQIVVNVNNGNFINKDSADVIGFEDVAKDDYVLTAYIGGRLYVQTAETITGTIEAYKQTKDTATSTGYRNTGFTVDGTAYTVSRVFTTTSDVYPAVDSVTKSIISSDATFYLDTNGNVIAYGEVDESAYKYAYVWDSDKPTNNLDPDRVKVTLEDGTTKTYPVDDDSQVQVASTGDLKGMAYAYSITSSGTIKLSLPAGGGVTSADPNSATKYSPVFTKGLTNIRFSDGTKTGKTGFVESDLTPADLQDGKTNNGELTPGSVYYSNNATTFFYVTYEKDGTTIDEVKVYNGRNAAPSVDGSKGTAILSLNRNGVVAAAVFDDVAVTESAGDHMFVFDAGYVWDEYGYVNAVFNDETAAQEDVKVAYVDTLGGEIVHNPDVADGIYLYRYNSDGYYEITKPSASYYVEGRVGSVNKGQNTFVIVDKNGNFLQECLLTNSSVVIDYDTSDTDPVISNGAIFSEGDEVKVIVNNADDGEVLMGVLWERADYTNQDDDTPNFDVDGALLMNKYATVAEVNAALKEGNVSIQGDWQPTDFATNKTVSIPANTTLKISGNFDADTLGLSIGTLSNSKLVVDGTFTTDKNIDYDVVAGELVFMIDGTPKADEISGDVSVAGDMWINECTTPITVSGNLSVKGDVETTNSRTQITVNVTGHHEVKGNTHAMVNFVVLSSSTLIVEGTVYGEITVGQVSPAREGRAVIGTVAGAVDVQNGTLEITTKFDSATTPTGAAGGQIIFADGATAPGAGASVFVAKNDATVSDVGGKTFTFNATAGTGSDGAFVTEDETITSATVELLYVYDAKSALQAGDTVYAWTDWTTNAEVAAKQPWLVVKVTPADGLSDVKLSKTDISFTKGGEELTLVTTEDKSLTYKEADNAFYFGVVAVTPYVEGHKTEGTQDYLTQEVSESEEGKKLGDVLPSSYAVTVKFNGETFTAECTLTADDVHVTEAGEP